MLSSRGGEGEVTSALGGEFGLPLAARLYNVALTN